MRVVVMRNMLFGGNEIDAAGTAAFFTGQVHQRGVLCYRLVSALSRLSTGTYGTTSHHFSNIDYSRIQPNIHECM